LSCGQNPQNMGVNLVGARAYGTASALRMVRELRIRGKDKCHTRRRKTQLALGVPTFKNT
jgi:hypothetical protein